MNAIAIKPGQVMTMSTREIAGLLNRQHSNIKISAERLAEKGVIVDRWQELEAGQAFSVPTTLSGALRLAAEQAETIERQQAQIAIAAPKVDYFDRVVERTTLMTATQVAQKLGMSAVTMNKHLVELEVYSRNVQRARVFKQWFIDKGLWMLKQTEMGYSQPLFTTAGEAWVIERLTSEGVI